MPPRINVLRDFPKLEEQYQIFESNWPSAAQLQLTATITCSRAVIFVVHFGRRRDDEPGDPSRIPIVCVPRQETTWVSPPFALGAYDRAVRVSVANAVNLPTDLEYDFALEELA